jgi:hypothetical protein
MTAVDLFADPACLRQIREEFDRDRLNVVRERAGAGT